MNLSPAFMAHNQAPEPPQAGQGAFHLSALFHRELAANLIVPLPIEFAETTQPIGLDWRTGTIAERREVPGLRTGSRLRRRGSRPPRPAR